MESPDEKNSCLGIYLWYLAGQKNRVNSAMKKTTKESKEIEDSYRTNLTWNKQREKFLKDEKKKTSLQQTKVMNGLSLTHLKKWNCSVKLL
jgi:hypothetical protein